MFYGKPLPDLENKKFCYFFTGSYFLMFYGTVIAWLNCFSVMLSGAEIKYLPTRVSNMLKEPLSFGQEDSFGPSQLWNEDWKNTYMEKIFTVLQYYLNLVLKI